MTLNKEQILTLTCLKDLGVKGIGPKKIFLIARTVIGGGYVLNNLEDLSDLMRNMKEKVINSVTLSDLNEAHRCAQRIVEQSESHNIGYVGFFDKDYPDLLRHTINEDGKEDPPLILWYRGDLSTTKIPGLAVIGTRECTKQGEAAGFYFSSQFAKRGFNIVSGLATGCDTCGHKGALSVSGKTTAILANGLDHNSIYPKENQDLAEEIVKNGGLLLSEYRCGSTVNRYSLVARDRLQAGLSLATLVVQTGTEGGTMHAANITLKSNKPLFTIRYKDDSTNKHDKCLGNAYLVNKGANYTSESDNLDLISDYINNNISFNKNFFDD